MKSEEEKVEDPQIEEPPVPAPAAPKVHDLRKRSKSKRRRAATIIVDEAESFSDVRKLNDEELKNLRK